MRHLRLILLVLCSVPVIVLIVLLLPVAAACDKLISVLNAITDRLHKI